MMISATLILACVIGHGPLDGPLSFSEGRALSAERGEVLLVLVHGSDWNLFSERLFKKIWQTPGFVSSVGVVLADIDVLQAPTKARRKANDARNAGWKKKKSGLRTYPAVLAYAPDGTRIGTRQGRDLPRDLGAARRTLLEFADCCRRWTALGKDIAAARHAKDATRELALLITRDRLPLDRAADLIDGLRRLDPDDTAGHHARLTFPQWTTLVQKATKEAQAGKGAQAEKRLRDMLANPAYTPEQRAVIYLGLGSAYRRWDGHGADAGASFEEAWRAAPESVSGRAGMRLFLQGYAGPSLSFGWTDRHTAGAATWTIEDFPTALEPGAYRLHLQRTRGGDLPIGALRLLSGGEPQVVDLQAFALTRAAPARDFEVTLTKPLTDVTLELSLGRGRKSRGTLKWTKLP